MGWALLDDNFPFHPKVLEAGPVAAYLFVCGLCYCRKYRTSGFISDAAVKTLGVTTNPKKLIDALVTARLWDRIDAGYQIHGYAEQYDDVGERESIDERKRKKQDAGRKGGLARAAAQAGNPLVNFVPSNAPSTVPSTSPSTIQARGSSTFQAHRTGEVEDLVEVPVVGSERKETPRYAEWLSELQEAYPVQRVTHGYTTGTAFFNVLSRHPLGPCGAWALMKSNLENQKRGHQWRVKKMTPRLEKWLTSGDWTQKHDENPPESIVNEKTAATLAAGDAFVRGGGR